METSSVQVGERTRSRRVLNWYSLQTESWFLLKEICITMSLSFTELEPPSRWKMVTSD